MSHAAEACLPQFNLYHNIRQIDPRTLSLSLAHSAQQSAKQMAGLESESEIKLVKCRLLDDMSQYLQLTEI